MKSQPAITEKNVIFPCVEKVTHLWDTLAPFLKETKKKILGIKVVGNFERKNFCFKLFSIYTIAHKIFTKNRFWGCSTTLKKVGTRDGIQMPITRPKIKLETCFWSHFVGNFIEFDPLALTPNRQHGTFLYGRTHIIQSPNEIILCRVSVPVCDTVPVCDNSVHSCKN